MLFRELSAWCNDAAHWSVRRDAIYEEFRKAGHVVAEPSDLTELRLEDIDKIVGFLDAKYKSIAAAQGPQPASPDFREL